MLHGRSSLFATAFAAVLLCCTAELALENNGYSGLVIALDPSAILPSLEEQEQIIDAIKTVMTRASGAVFEATNHRAYFSDVTIVIPEDWSINSDKNTTGRWESWKWSNIKVVSEGRHNSAPLTVPGGGCGVPGASIEVPLAYLTAENVQLRYGDIGAVMAAEWLKYRYGVYEEHGYPGDALYPHAYLDVVSNQTRPTGCTDHEALVGTWQNSNDQECVVTTEDGGLDPQCRFVVEDTVSDYSIMYITHIPEVIHVCNEETHDPAIPTRHNILCNGKSIWEVIMQHHDFTDGKNPPDESRPDTTPIFTVASPSQPALYFIIDDNCGKKDESDTGCPGKVVYTKLRETVRRVLTSTNLVPRVALRKYFGSFSAAFNKKDPLIPIEDLDVDAFMDFFPTLDFERKENTTSPENALVATLNDIAGSDYIGEVNIFLVQMIWTEEDGMSYPDVLMDEVTVTSVLYGDTAYNPWMRDLTLETNGKFLFDPNYNPLDAQNALLDLVPDIEEVILLQTETSLDSEVVLDVYVDPGVGIDTTFTVEFTKTSGGTLVLTDPDGNDVTVQLPSTAVPDAATGKWSMSIKNSNNGMASVFVTSNPRLNIDQIEVTTWTSASSLGEVDLSTNGLVFYVSVTQGNKAIKDLEITVTYYAGKAVATYLQVTLLDDGLGNPDVQRNDGIYSGYVVDFASEAGPETIFFADVSVTAASSSSLFQSETINYISTLEDFARILPQDPFGEEPCCGSLAPDAISVPLSRSIIGATSVVILNGPGDNAYNPPPSQVTGALVTNVEKDGPFILAGTVLVSLSWKAPGKDFTVGTVSGYEIWYSDSKTDIINDFTACNLVQDDEYEGDKPIPGEYGTEQTVTIRLPKKVEEEAQYYLVVVGLDGDQKGSPSFLLSVPVTAGVPYTTQSTTTQPTTTTEPSTTIPTTTTEPSTTTTEPSTTTTEPSTTIPTTTTKASATSAETTTKEFTTTTEKPTMEPSSTEESSSVESIISTHPSAATTTEDPSATQPTKKPDDFVGSPGFWAIIGVTGLVILLIIAFFIYRCIKKNRKRKQGSSLALNPKDKKDKKLKYDTSAYDSVRMSNAGKKESLTTPTPDSDAEKGLPTPGTTSTEELSSPPAAMGVINEGFDDEEPSDSDDDLMTSF